MRCDGCRESNPATAGEAGGQRVAAAVQRVQDLPGLGGALARGQEGGGDVEAAAPAARRAGSPPVGVEEVSARGGRRIALRFGMSLLGHSVVNQGDDGGEGAPAAGIGTQGIQGGGGRWEPSGRCEGSQRGPVASRCIHGIRLAVVS